MVFSRDGSLAVAKVKVDGQEQLLNLRSQELIALPKGGRANSWQDPIPVGATSLICPLNFADGTAATIDLGGDFIAEISHFNPQALANTAWAFATLLINNSQLFDALGQEATKQISLFNPQNLANTAWAFATLGMKNDRLFGALAQEATKQLSHFNPQALANTAWAFATLGIKNDRFFGALSQEAINKVSHFKAQELANTAWAFAVDFPELV